MIVYYKYCSVCFKLYPKSQPLVRRDTERTQRFHNNHMDITVPAGNLTLEFHHNECSPK